MEAMNSTITELHNQASGMPAFCIGGTNTCSYRTVQVSALDEYPFLKSVLNQPFTIVDRDGVIYVYGSMPAVDKLCHFKLYAEIILSCAESQGINVSNISKIHFTTSVNFPENAVIGSEPVTRVLENVSCHIPIRNEDKSVMVVVTYIGL